MFKMLYNKTIKFSFVADDLPSLVRCPSCEEASQMDSSHQKDCFEAKRSGSKLFTSIVESIKLFMICMLVICLSGTTTQAAIKSGTGLNIDFDAGNDGHEEVKITTNGYLSIGENAPSSNLHVAGTIANTPLSVSGNSSVTIDDSSLVFADSTSGNISLVLPDPSTCVGRQVKIFKTSDNNTVYVSSTNATINNNDFYSLAYGLQSLSVVSNSQSWYIQNSHGSGVNPSDDPLAISTNCILWLDGTNTNSVDVSGNIVERWSDLSPISQGNATSNVVNYRPSYVTNGINGRNSLMFAPNTNPNFLELGLSTSANSISNNGDKTTFSVFQVSNNVPQGTGSFLYTGVDNGNVMLEHWYKDGNIHYKDNGTSTLNEDIGLATSTAIPCISTMYRFNDSITHNLITDSTDETQSFDESNITPPAASIFNKFTIGARPGGTKHFHGLIGEIIIYNKKLSAQEINDVQNYLKVKWGIGVPWTTRDTTKSITRHLQECAS